MTKTHFTFVILNYNTTPEQALRCIRSCLDQAYDGEWDVVWIDDHSDDKESYEAASRLAKSNPKLMVCRERERTYGLGALYDAIECAYESNPSTVIYAVGGDDWVHELLLVEHDKAYQCGAWCVYNQSYDGPFGEVLRLGRAKEIDMDTFDLRSFRGAPYVTLFGSYYASLFMKIKQEDLMINGRWVEASADTHIWFPLLEMSSGDRGRVVFLNDPLYRYVCGEPGPRSGDYYLMQSFLHWRSRHMKQYLPLDSLTSASEYAANTKVSYTIIFSDPMSALETFSPIAFNLTEEKDNASD